MITDYLKSCGYKLNRLKNHIYLYDDKKKIRIDHQRAYVDNLQSNPIEITGFNISFQEETSLDERYKFSKTLKISINGRLNKNDLPTNIYAIIESYDGTYFFTNPDFPYKLTYSFNLSEGVNQTDITLTASSNMPVLEVVSNSFENVSLCKIYQHNGIKSLKLLEKEKVNFSTLSDEIVSTDEWKNIEYLKGSPILQEYYDGNKITSSIQFNIDFSKYKSDWQYRLLEFKDNRYTAIVEANDYYKYYVGFITGLQPNYNVSTTSQDNEADIITISLVEVSNYGIDDRQDLTEYYNSLSKWIYVRQAENYKTYECYGGPGWARFLVKSLVDYFGNPLGQYLIVKDVWDCLNDDDPDIDHSYCHEHYDNLLNLNIVGTFDDYYDNKTAEGTNYFPTSECVYLNPEQCVCIMNTDIPTSLTFISTGQQTYSLSASSDWRIETPEGITVSPSTGNGDTNYTITITNSLNPSTSAGTYGCSIKCCQNIRYFYVNVDEATSCISPMEITTNCRAKTLQFAYDKSCPIEVTSITKDGLSYSGLTYQINNGTLLVNIPENPYTNKWPRFELTINNCGCSTSATTIIIHQLQMYEMWLTRCENYEDANTCDYICSGTSKYYKEYRYTGTSTVTTSMVQTGEFRAGNLISTNSTECSSIRRFAFLNHYICIDGNKYELLEEEISLDNGITFVPTGVVKLGEFVEENSTFCEQTITYEWRLTTNWICQEIE